MTDAVYVVSELLRTVCYFILFLDLSARMMPWIGAENTYTGRVIRSVSLALEFPFFRLLRRAIDRYPMLERIPALMGTVFIYLLAVSIP